MKENSRHFQHIMLHYFKKGKNATEKKKKRFVQFMEKMLEHVKSGLQSFVLEISHWRMLRGRVDPLKLIMIKLGY